MKHQKWIIALMMILIFCVFWTMGWNEGFETRNPFDKVDVIYYINLDHRKDRNNEMRSEEHTSELQSH